MSTKSEIGIIAAVDGDAATARWRASQPSSEAQILPPVQVQALPGNQINSLSALALGPDGAWYIGGDDVVYYAPYQTGVFAPILTLPTYRPEPIVRVAVPGYLVIHYEGTRWVSIVSLQRGLILEQELPALPTGSDPDTSMAGVVYEGDSADRIAIMFRSLDGHLRGYSYTTMESPGALFGVMPRVDVLTYSDPEYLWRGHALIALAARAYQLPDIRGFFEGYTTGRASPDGIYSYNFTVPDPEVNPGLGVEDYAVTASPVSTLTWEPSGASATLYMDTVVRGSGYKWDYFPLPVTTNSTLTIRIEPVVLGTTHGTINIGGESYPLRATNSDFSFSSYTTFYSDRIRQNDMLLAAGGTYPVSLSIYTSSSGSSTTPITLVSGGDPDRSGFREGEFGSVSTTNVFQEGGVVRRLVRLESNRVNITREPWSGGLVWLVPPSLPPFWTGFVRTIEDIDAGTTPDPDPDPDPDPSDGIAIVLLAGAHAVEPGIGYAPWLEMGGVDSDTLQVGGQTGTLTLLVYDYEAGELVMAVDNLNGITSIILRIEGGEALTLSPTPDPALWIASLAESPFVDGHSYLLDLLIEAVEAPDEGEQYADFEMVAGTSSDGWNVVGFVASQVGTLQPDDPVIGGISGYVYAIVYDISSGELTVEIDDIFGASGATLTVDGVGDFVLDVEDSEYGFSGSLSMPDSPFVDGETYSVRLYLDGELTGPSQDVVFDTTVTIGDIGGSMRGYEEQEEVGFLDPDYFPTVQGTVFVDLLAFAPSELMYPESPGRTLVTIFMYIDAAGQSAVSLESASLAFNGLVVEFDHIESFEGGVGLVGLLPESAGNWLPDFDDQIHITLTLQGFEIPDPAPEEPYEPVGDPIAIAIEAAGEDSPVGFSYNARGSVGPSTIEYEGRTLTILTADMYNHGEGDVEFFFELIGDATGLTFAGSGFDIGGVLVGAEAGNYTNSVQFWAWHEDLQPWQDGETYTITFYPGQEG